MICPECGEQDNDAVDRTMDIGAVVYRSRKCKCGHEWKTEERVFKLALVKRHLRIRRQGGTLSSSDLSVPQTPGPLSNSDLTRSDRVEETPQPRRGRGDSVGYPAEFEELWLKCKGPKGNKHPAFKVWQRLKPPLTLTIERWALWMTTDGWRRGFSKHMATWLNAKGWQDEPHPDELRPKTGQAKAPILPLAVQAERNAAAALEDARERATFEKELKIPFVDPHSIDWTTGKKKVAP